MSTFIFRALASEVEKETIDNILSLSQKTFLNSTVYTFLLKYFIDSHENLRTQFSNSVDTVLQKIKKHSQFHVGTRTPTINGQHEMDVMHADEHICRFCSSLFFSSNDDVFLLYFSLDYLILMTLRTVHSPGTQTRSLATGWG